MKRKTTVPDCKARHTVVFSADEAKNILAAAAYVAGEGLPAGPTFIYFPHGRWDAEEVIIGVEVDAQ